MEHYSALKIEKFSISNMGDSPIYTVKEKGKV